MSDSLFLKLVASEIVSEVIKTDDFSVIFNCGFEISIKASELYERLPERAKEIILPVCKIKLSEWCQKEFSDWMEREMAVDF